MSDTVQSRNPFCRAATRVISATALVLLAACAAPAPEPPPEIEAPSRDLTIVYLMRHAEAVPPPYDEDPPNPHLRDGGTERAATLARVLGDEPITGVFSTDYNRTRETAAPVAEAHGLEVTLYDPRDPAPFVERLRATPGRHVVVGHSNTTPALVEALGGDPGPPIEDAWEYDRLYVVTLGADGSVTTVTLRYGAPSTPTE